MKKVRLQAKQGGGKGRGTGVKIEFGCSSSIFRGRKEWGFRENDTIDWDSEGEGEGETVSRTSKRVLRKPKLE